MKRPLKLTLIDSTPSPTEWLKSHWKMWSFVTDREQQLQSSSSQISNFKIIHGRKKISCYISTNITFWVWADSKAVVLHLWADYNLLRPPLKPSGGSCLWSVSLKRGLREVKAGQEWSQFAKNILTVLAETQHGSHADTKKIKGQHVLPAVAGIAQIQLCSRNTMAHYVGRRTQWGSFKPSD